MDWVLVVFDIATEDDSRRDLAAGRFDAGIHLGAFVQRDMVAVKVISSGPLIFNDVELTLRAALDGVGLAFELEEHAAGHIARGR